jgi:hypothetical protein
MVHDHEKSDSAIRRLGAVCRQALVSREPGTAPGACFAGSHSPWPSPLAPPAPRRIAPPCSSASSLSPADASPTSSRMPAHGSGPMPGQPLSRARSPADASPTFLADACARLGADAVRYSFIV